MIDETKLDPILEESVPPVPEEAAGGTPDSPAPDPSPDEPAVAVQVPAPAEGPDPSAEEPSQGEEPVPMDDPAPAEGDDLTVVDIPLDDPAPVDEPTGPVMDPGRMVGPDRARSGRPRRGWNLGYFLREGFVSIFRHGLMSFAAVCMTVACLLIMGTFTLVAVNLDANLKELERSNEFSAYIDEALSDDQAKALEERLLQVPNVRSAQFVDRVDVLADFRAERSDEAGLFELLPDDTFRHRYRIHVDDLEQLQATVDAVEKVPGIATTSSFVDGAEGMLAVRNVAAGVAVILVAILAVVSLFIIANTLRLATFYRRDEIAIMRMCGATNGFICWPFVMEGAMLGLFSAALAFGLQWWVYNMIAGAVKSAGQLGFLVVAGFESLWPLVLGAFCASGLVIGVLGSLLAIRRFLRV